MYTVALPTVPQLICTFENVGIHKYAGDTCALGSFDHL